MTAKNFTARQNEEQRYDLKRRKADDMATALANVFDSIAALGFTTYDELVAAKKDSDDPRHREAKKLYLDFEDRLMDYITKIVVRSKKNSRMIEQISKTDFSFDDEDSIQFVMAQLFGIRVKGEHAGERRIDSILSLENGVHKVNSIFKAANRYLIDEGIKTSVKSKKLDTVCLDAPINKDKEGPTFGEMTESGTTAEDDMIAKAQERESYTKIISLITDPVQLYLLVELTVTDKKKDNTSVRLNASTIYKRLLNHTNTSLICESIGRLEAIGVKLPYTAYSHLNRDSSTCSKITSMDAKKGAEQISRELNKMRNKIAKIYRTSNMLYA